MSKVLKAVYAGLLIALAVLAAAGIVTVDSLPWL